MKQPTIDDVPIACVPAAILASQRPRWLDLGKAVYGAVEMIRELPDGWACRLPGDAQTLLRVAEYISLDRLCCPFVDWALMVERGGGPLWLHQTGSPGAKELIRGILQAHAPSALGPIADRGCPTCTED